MGCRFDTQRVYANGEDGSDGKKMWGVKARKGSCVDLTTRASASHRTASDVRMARKSGPSIGCPDLSA